MKNNLKSGKSGFTLVELLAVVAIIAILATIVISSIGNATSMAKDAAVMRQQQVLNSAFQSYIAAGGDLFVNEAATEVMNAMITYSDPTTGIRGPFLLQAAPTTMINSSGSVNLQFASSRFGYILP